MQKPKKQNPYTAPPQSAQFGAREPLTREARTEDRLRAFRVGAAKGFCHSGHDRMLEARGVRPDSWLSRTRRFPLSGALYCHYGNVAGVIARVEDVLASKYFLSNEANSFDASTSSTRAMTPATFP